MKTTYYIVTNAEATLFGAESHSTGGTYLAALFLNAKTFPSAADARAWLYSMTLFKTAMYVRAVKAEILPWKST